MSQTDLFAPPGPTLTLRQVFSICLRAERGRDRGRFRERLEAYLPPDQVDAVEELVKTGRFQEWRRGEARTLGQELRDILRGGSLGRPA